MGGIGYLSASERLRESEVNRPFKAFNKQVC